MATTFPTLLFSSPFELQLPTLSLDKLLALPKLFVLLSVLVLGVVVWSSVVWTTTQITSLVSGYTASYVEEVKPVMPDYYW